MNYKQKPKGKQKAVYTPEYRAQAVKLAVEGAFIAEAARNLGENALWLGECPEDSQCRRHHGGGQQGGRQ